MSLIIGIFIAVLALIFSFQNIETITVNFFQWEFTSSLALILLAALVIGFVTCLIFLSPSIFKSNMLIRKLTKKNKDLEEGANNQGIIYETEGLGSESVRIGDDEVKSDNDK